MCFRIEADERKHNRNWEEDWGSREKNKSLSPGPSPLPPSHSPPPSKPRSSGTIMVLMPFSMLTTVLLCMNVEREILQELFCSSLMLICTQHTSPRHFLTFFNSSVT